MEERIRPLKSIRTEEEYENYKKYLQRCLDEYKLFMQYGDKLPELMASRAKEYEEGSDARVALEQRERLINNGEYAASLERNITAYMLSMDEFEAKKENRSLFDVIKGIITKDDDTKNYLKRRYMKSRAEDMGLLEPVNLNLQDPYDSVRQIFEEYDFINIPKPEFALVPVDTEINKIFTEVREMLDECLKENGISAYKEEQNIERKSSLNLQKDIKFDRRNNINKEKTPKDNDEIGDEI